MGQPDGTFLGTNLGKIANVNYKNKNTNVPSGIQGNLDGKSRESFSTRNSVPAWVTLHQIPEVKTLVPTLSLPKVWKFHPRTEAEMGRERMDFKKHCR